MKEANLILKRCYYEMWEFILCLLIWVGFFALWVTNSIPKHRIYEIYAGSGIGICLTVLILSFFDWFQPQSNFIIFQVLSIIGSLLYISAIIIAIGSFISLKQGKPKGWIEYTTIFVEKGLFRVIRHPLYFGLALWSIGLILLLQSLPSTILGVLALCCFWMASKVEDQFNIEYFGESYRNYMKRVPMWNILKRIE